MMNQNNLKNSEIVSALVDGQLKGDDFAQAVTLTVTDLQSHADWHAFHVVGDALRSPELADCAGDAAFLRRFRERLTHELAGNASGYSSQLVTPKIIAIDEYSARGNDSKRLEVRSANESSFRWKLLAGVASIAAVAAIGWSSLGVISPAGADRQLAQTSPSPISSGPALAPVTGLTATAQGGDPVMIRDPHLDALMAAHKQFGGTSALQMPAGFLRNATFENNAR